MADVTITLTEDEALVLFEFFQRFSDRDRLTIDHPAEYLALLRISRQLDETLFTRFDPDYQQLLADARQCISPGFEGKVPGQNDNPALFSLSEIEFKENSATNINKIYINAIEVKVWSGFYSPDDVLSEIDYMTEVDKELLKAVARSEFAKKANAEASWTEQTDCDRLDEAFQILNSNGIIALQNAGYTMSDGLSDVSMVECDRGRENVKGYCFYHSQNLEKAILGKGLSLAFGDLDGNEIKTVEIGNIIKQTLEEKGFTVKWNGDPQVKLNIPNFDWKRKWKS